MTTYSEYSVDDEISTFFSKTSVSRQARDARAIGLCGGTAAAVDVQRFCSYSVYAGPQLEYVVQFRLKSLALKTDTATLAREVHGTLAPEASFKGIMGDEMDSKEPLCIYLMSRIQGITHLDFILAHGFPENSRENFAWRQNLITDVARYAHLPAGAPRSVLSVARFFALSWEHPQHVEVTRRNYLGQTYVRELRLLLSALPERFHPIVETCIQSMDAVLSLPMVLLHRDFGTCNIKVDDKSCHLAGVIDWAEAEIGPFGLNLYSLETLTGKFHSISGTAGSGTRTTRLYTTSSGGPFSSKLGL